MRRPTRAYTKSAMTAAIIVMSLLFSATASALGNMVYTNTRWLADNHEYRNTISWHETLGRTEDFAIRMTGPGDAYPIVLNGDTVFGTSRISTIVSFAEGLGKNVLAVVNTDFFFAENGGIPMGIVIEGGVYKSSPGGRNAIAFGTDGSVHFVPAPTVIMSLFNHGGGEGYDNYGKSTDGFRHFNKPRTEQGGLVLYSEAFSTVSTRTDTPGWFVRFRIIEGSPSVSGTMELEVADKLMSDGAIPIGEGFLVLTAADRSYLGAEFDKYAVGDRVTLTAVCSDERLEGASYATGGGDILVSDGEKADKSGWSPSLAPRAPRTAFGARADGTVISYVVDGRNSEHSVGLTLDELANEMLLQGCVYAVNLDGGGSSALSVRIPGEARAAVANRPSDGAERGCATYLLFVTDASPGGGARNLGLRNDGAIVLAGSSVELAFTATDRGYMPVAAPGDIAAAPLVQGSSVSGNLYTAGSTAGADSLALTSPSTGAAGTGEIFVIARPTSITPRRPGSSAPLAAIKLYPCETLEIDVTATYYRRAVIAQLHSFAFDVSGNIGEMEAPGVFVAGAVPKESGTITVSAGGRSAEIRVEIGGFTDMIGHWAREFAEYLESAGITGGVAPAEYGPELPMLRSDFVLMLYRAAGQPPVSGSSGFDDVPEETYYAQAVAWAREAGITTGGTGDNKFSPRAPLTRNEAFTFVYRALAILGIEYSEGSSEDLERFPDAGSVAGYAAVPTATLVKLGVIEGSNGLLLPQTTLTRAQMAKVLATVLWLLRSPIEN